MKRAAPGSTAVRFASWLARRSKPARAGRQRSSTRTLLRGRAAATARGGNLGLWAAPAQRHELTLRVEALLQFSSANPSSTPAAGPERSLARAGHVQLPSSSVVLALRHLSAWLRPAREGVREPSRLVHAIPERGAAGSGLQLPALPAHAPIASQPRGLFERVVSAARDHGAPASEPVRAPSNATTAPADVARPTQASSRRIEFVGVAALARSRAGGARPLRPSAAATAHGRTAVEESTSKHKLELRTLERTLHGTASSLYPERAPTDPRAAPVARDAGLAQELQEIRSALRRRAETTRTEPARIDVNALGRRVQDEIERHARIERERRGQ